MVIDSRMFRRLLVLAYCLAGLAGCGVQPAKTTPVNPTTGANGTKSAELTPVEIQLNWKPEAEHGGYYAAVVHGFYAEEGLDVKLTPGGPGTPLMESVATNRIPFGVDNADKLLRARAEEADVVAVFAPIQDSPRCIMVHEESGIKRLVDLGDGEVTTLAWNSSQPFAQYLLKNLDLSKLEMTKYSGVGPFLLDKKSAMQAYSISEPFVARQQGAKPVVLMLSEMGFNTYTSLLLTNQQVLKEQPELVRKVVRASQRGWLKYLTQGEETNRYIAGLNEEMPVEVLAFGVQELNSLRVFDKVLENTGYPETPKAMNDKVAETRRGQQQTIGRMELDRWQTLVRQLEEIQLIEPGSTNAKAAFTTEFLPGM